MTAPPITYLPYATGLRCPIEDCSLGVLLDIDRHGSCVRRGGCSHIVSIEAVNGRLRVGFVGPVE